MRQKWRDPRLAFKHLLPNATRITLGKFNKLCIKKWLKTFDDSHRICHFHVAVKEGITYTIFVNFFSPFGMRAFQVHFQKLPTWCILYPLSLPHGNDKFYDYHQISLVTFLMQSLLWIMQQESSRVGLCFIYCADKHETGNSFKTC